MINARAAALFVLERFFADPGDPERIIESAIAGKPIDHRDRRFIFELVYGVIRRGMTIDFYIEQLLSDKHLMNNTLLLNILRLGIYQILFLDRVPAHAAVNESVKLTKKAKHTYKFAGTVNALLRKIISLRKQLPQPDPGAELSYRLGIGFSHPQWLVARWLKQFGLADTKKLLTFNNTIPATYIRRRLRGLSRQAFESETCNVCSAVAGYKKLYYRLTKSLETDILELLEQGTATVQAPSSGWVVALLDPVEGDRCLDLCAAPGGKASLMAELVGENGFVVALDRSPHRMRKVIDTRERMELRLLLPLLGDAVRPPLCAQFTKVLLDVPCTATGVMQRHPDARWARNEEHIAHSAACARELLESAAQTVAHNGILVYSTCSLEPEENEQQIDAFLSVHSEFVLEKGGSAIPGQYIDEQGFLRITPFEHGLDAIFAARMRRTANL